MNYDFFCKHGYKVLNTPDILIEPPGYQPSIKLSELGKTGEFLSNHFGYTDYQIDLAVRAYERLFANRTFSFEDLKPGVLQHEVAAWKAEIEDVEAHDDTVREEYEEERVDHEGGEVWVVDEIWDAYSDIDVEDRAFHSLYDHRPFKLQELRPEARDREIVRWRQELIRMNKEDRLIFRQPEPTTEHIAKQELRGSPEFRRSTFKLFAGGALIEKSGQKNDEPESEIDKLLIGDDSPSPWIISDKSRTELQIESWQTNAFDPELVKHQNSPEHFNLQHSQRQSNLDRHKSDKEENREDDDNQHTR